MVDFRRVITVLGILVLFVGLASAQNALTCTAQGTVPPQLRAEGYTEQTGDITITCTGGTPTLPGAQIPQVNISVTYNTAVTSRLLPSGTVTPLQGSISEALLMIDEPGGSYASIPNSYFPQLPCVNPAQGCLAAAGNNPADLGPTGLTLYGQAVDATGGLTPNTNGRTSATVARNIYQGVSLGNSVTFYGVPVLAPGTQGSRVFRISNVRVNANALGSGSASGAQPINGSIIMSGATSLTLSNSQPVVGYVWPGLSASINGTGSGQQCVNGSQVAATTLRFTEGFGNAFKTRVMAASTSLYAGQISTPTTQNVPGTIYYSESNYVIPVNGGTQMSGLADYGTRLKATFTNIPTGVRVFVSTTNNPATVPAPVGGSAGNLAPGAATYSSSLASLVTGETVVDGATPPLVSTNIAGLSEISITAGTGTAVWEVLNTNPNVVERLEFAVALSWTSNTAQNQPTPGTSTVNLSFAPTATSGAASAILGIPRFAADSAAPRPFFTFVVCRTILLYPYVTSAPGFDTGLAVANTSQDPFTTGSNTTIAQNGVCTITFYGTGAPATPTVTPSVAGGTVWANQMTNIAQGFTGYAFAICNFQYAHGFAFVSDVGVRNFAMGYLPLIIPDPLAGARKASPLSYGADGSGEQDAH